jgi:hypothetical protein
LANNSIESSRICPLFSSSHSGGNYFHVREMPTFEVIVMMEETKVCGNHSVVRGQPAILLLGMV